MNGETLLIRPTFAALVAAEQELGPLFSLTERAAEGKTTLAEIATLTWHCLHEPPAAITRDLVGEAIVEGGLAAAMPMLRVILTQILQGR